MVLALLLLLAVVSGTSAVNVTFIPHLSHKFGHFVANNISRVTLRVTADTSLGYNLTVHLSSTATKVIQLQNDSISLPLVARNQTFLYEGDFWVDPKFLGHANITALLGWPGGGQTESMKVAVERPFSKYQMVFAAVVTVIMTSVTFMMGTQVHWAVIWRVLKKPIGPTIGFACQFIIMPIAAYLWGLLLLPGDPYLQLGYFAVGCCPGGKMSNLWCILLDANLDLSVTLTACSNFIAFAMMPLWLLTVGSKVIVKGTDIKIPFLNMAGTLLLIIVPTSLGMGFAVKYPRKAEYIGRILKPITVTLIVILTVVAASLNTYVFTLFTWKNILAGMILPWTGFAVAFVVSWSLFRILYREKAEKPTDPDTPEVRSDVMRDSKTVAVETGIQNAALAILIIIYTLNQPDADLTLVMPVVCMMFTPIPLALAALIGLGVKRRCFRAKIADGEATGEKRRSGPIHLTPQEVSVADVES